MRTRRVTKRRSRKMKHKKTKQGKRKTKRVMKGGINNVSMGDIVEDIKKLPKTEFEEKYIDNNKLNNIFKKKYTDKSKIERDIKLIEKLYIDYRDFKDDKTTDYKYNLYNTVGVFRTYLVSNRNDQYIRFETYMAGNPQTTAAINIINYIYSELNTEVEDVEE